VVEDVELVELEVVVVELEKEAELEASQPACSLSQHHSFLPRDQPACQFE